MNLKLEIEFSKAEILQEVDALKQQIDDMRPLPEDVEGKVMQKLRLDWNYNSNAIEGNKLSYGETVAFLMEGITAKGKPLKDHLDIRGHNEAILFLTSLVKESRLISEADIRSLHEMILVEPYNSPAQTPDGLPTTKKITLGEYKKQPNHVKTATGELHYYATPEETPAKMQELMEWYNEVINNKDIHPLVIAALFHHKFVEIHPFDDGNGRLSRILMNLILMQKGFPPVIVKMDDRQNYYSLLSRADNGENWPFVEYNAERLFNSLQLFLRAAMGGDIEEDDDIDKEIALFKQDVQSKISNKSKIDSEGIYNFTVEQIFPLIEKMRDKASLFNELFFDKKTLLQVNYVNLFEKINDSYSTIINKELDISQFFNFFTNKAYKVSSISLDIQFLKFKDEDNIFDVTGSLMVLFHSKEYNIVNHSQEFNLHKSYNEILTKIDEKNIIDRILRDIKGLIEEHIGK